MSGSAVYSWKGSRKRSHGALQDERRLQNDVNFGQRSSRPNLKMSSLLDDDLALRAFDDAEEFSSIELFPAPVRPTMPHLVLRVP